MRPSTRGTRHGTRIAFVAAVAAAVALAATVRAGRRPAPDAAAQAQPMEVVGQIGAAVRDLAVDGDWLYVAVGSRIAAVDASDPGQPLVAAWTGPLARLPADLAAENGYVHVALERTGYQVIDATDPTRLRKLGYLEGRLRWPRAIAVSGDRAVIVGSSASEHGDSLTVYDVATPAAPAYRGETELQSTWYRDAGLEILGSTAWAADRRSIRIFDIGQAGRPISIRQLEWPGWQLNDLTSDAAVALVTGGPVPTPPSDTWPTTEAGAGAASGTASTLGYSAPRGPAVPAGSSALLRLLDVATPRAPVELAEVELARLEMGEAVAAARGRAFVLAQNPWTIHAFDVSDPAAVTHLGQLPLDRSDAPTLLMGRTEMQALGASSAHLALLTARALRIIDASDPALPRQAGSVEMSPWGIRGVAALGSHAYVADDRFGLRVVDATDPAQPRLVGDAPIVGRRLSAVAVTERAGGDSGASLRLAIAVGFGYGLFSFDVTDPTSPRLLGSVDTAGTSRDVAVAGQLAFVADGDRGLQIVDISDPAAPRLRGSLVVPSTELPAPHAYYVAVEGDRAYVAYKSEKLVQVVDVSNPDLPRELGRTPERIGNVEPAAIAVADGRLYVAGSSSGSQAGLEVYDARAPGNPRQVGFLASDSGLYGLALAGDLAYTGPFEVAGKPTLLEVDISSPARPRALRSVEVPGYYHQLAIDGGLLFAAENGNGQFSEAGLTIVRTHLGETATATPDGTSPTPGASPSPTATAPTPAVSATATASLPPGPPDVLYFPFADR